MDGYPYAWDCGGCGLTHHEKVDPTGKMLVCPNCGARNHLKAAHDHNCSIECMASEAHMLAMEADADRQIAEAEAEPTDESAHFHVGGDGALYYENGVRCGRIAKDVDGYCYWWPPSRRGSWQGYALREIADLLDQMNAEWDATVASDLSTPPGESTS